MDEISDDLKLSSESTPSIVFPSGRQLAAQIPILAFASDWTSELPAGNPDSLAGFDDTDARRDFDPLPANNVSTFAAANANNISASNGVSLFQLRAK